MARSGTAGIGGPPGTNPIGDRPGTTSTAGSLRMWDTPSGRAQLMAAGCFLVIVLLHVAAENR